MLTFELIQTILHSMKNMTDYIKRLRSWFYEGKFLFIFIILILFFFYLDDIFIDYKTVDKIRFYGLVFQLIGTLTLVYSLKDKLFTFNNQHLTGYFLNYFKRFPLKRASLDCRLEGNATGHSNNAGELRLVKRPPEDLKEIIKYLEEEFQYLNNKLDREIKELKKKLADLSIKSSIIKNELSKEINETRNLIINSSVSNIWSETFGLFCVFIGLILGTAPDFIEYLFF